MEVVELWGSKYIGFRFVSSLKYLEGAIIWLLQKLLHCIVSDQYNMHASLQSFVYVGGGKWEAVHDRLESCNIVSWVVQRRVQLQGKRTHQVLAIIL